MSRRVRSGSTRSRSPSSTSRVPAPAIDDLGSGCASADPARRSDGHRRRASTTRGRPGDVVAAACSTAIAASAGPWRRRSTAHVDPRRGARLSCRRRSARRLIFDHRRRRRRGATSTTVDGNWSTDDVDRAPARPDVALGRCVDAAPWPGGARSRARRRRRARSPRSPSWRCTRSGVRRAPAEVHRRRGRAGTRTSPTSVVARRRRRVGPGSDVRRSTCTSRATADGQSDPHADDAGTLQRRRPSSIEQRGGGRGDPRRGRRAVRRSTTERCGERWPTCITGARPLPGAAATTFGHTRR